MKKIIILLLILFSINLYADMLFPKNNGFGIKYSEPLINDLNNHWVMCDFTQKFNLILIKDLIQNDKRVILSVKSNNLKLLEDSVKALSNNEIVWLINRDKNSKNFKDYATKSIDIIKKYDKSAFVFIDFGNDINFIKANSNIVLNNVDGICYNSNFSTIYHIFEPYILKGKKLSFMTIIQDRSLEKDFISNIFNNIEINVYDNDFYTNNKLNTSYYSYKNLCQLFSQNPNKMVNNKYYYYVLSDEKIISKSFYSKNKFSDANERLIITLWTEDNKKIDNNSIKENDNIYNNNELDNNIEKLNKPNSIIVIRNLFKVRGVYSFDYKNQDYNKAFTKIDYEIRNNDLIINRNIDTNPQILVIDF